MGEQVAVPLWELLKTRMFGIERSCPKHIDYAAKRITEIRVCWTVACNFLEWSLAAWWLLLFLVVVVPGLVWHHGACGCMAVVLLFGSKT